MEPAKFDPQLYWSQRLGETFTLAAVGWEGFGEPFNRWAYRVRRRRFLSAAREAVPDLASAEVLDVGMGTGFYVSLWHVLGVRRVTGSDLTGLAVERLRGRYPQDGFVQLDITAELDPEFLGRFDAVSAMDVLFHVVEDEQYVRALHNLGALLRPGGVLLLSENLVHGAWLAAKHQVSRDIDWIARHVHAAGLQIISRRPMFVLMNNPVDTRSRILRRWWGGLTSALHRWPAAADLVGASLYPVELALTSLLREGPSTELVVCRKRSLAIGTAL